MLFMNRTPMDAEATKYEEYSIPDQNAARNNLRTVAIAITIFYLFLSLIIVMFYPPISLVSLIFPGITIFLVLCAMKSPREDAFWPCILMGSLGLLLKLVACIVFLSLFGFSGFSSDNRKLPNPRTLLSKNSKGAESLSSDMRALFFTILAGAEFFLFIITCCVQWHLVAFRKCMQQQ